MGRRGKTWRSGLLTRVRNREHGAIVQAGKIPAHLDRSESRYPRLFPPPKTP